MTGTNFAALVRNYTKTNSTTLADAEIVLLANTVKDDIASRIAEAKEDEFAVPATRDLVLNQREYDLPSDKLNAIVKVEAKFSTGGDYFPLKFMDLNKYGNSSQESIIVANFSNEQGHAFYDIIRNSLYIYSGAIVAVTSGLKVWYNAFPQDIAAADLAGSTDLSVPASSTQVAIPRMFHELWARNLAMLWKQTRQKPIPLSERELKFDIDFSEKISSNKVGDEDRDLTASLPDDTRLQG